MALDQLSSAWPIVADGFSPPAIVPGEVQLWRIAVDDVDPGLGDLGAQLSPDERSRASHFRQDDDIRRYVIARAALRQILSIASGRPATSIDIEIAEGGKPIWRAVPELDFNLSHSGNLVLIGLAAATVAAERPGIGVDVEQKRQIDKPLELAKRIFEPHVVHGLAETPAPQRLDAFYVEWVRTEARLKAAGIGLIGKRTDTVQRMLARTVVTDLVIDAGYAAALATVGSSTTPICHTWRFPD